MDKTKVSELLKQLVTYRRAEKVAIEEELVHPVNDRYSLEQYRGIADKLEELMFHTGASQVVNSVKQED